MSFTKQAKDKFIKFMLGKASVPSGLAELNHYFRLYQEINFKNEEQDDGSIIAISTDFKYGSIIAQAKNKKELDSEIKDAILTAFEVPSSYAKEAAINRVGNKEYAYA